MAPSARAVVPVAVAVLAAVVGGVPTLHADAPAAAGLASQQQPAAGSPGTSSLRALEVSPPPPEVEVSCTSHDVYEAVLNAVSMTENLTIQETYAVASNSTINSVDTTTQIVVLATLGLMSVGLLVMGGVLMTAALAITLFVLVFSFMFGVIDNLSYDQEEGYSFSMCVLPFVLAVLVAALASVSAVCLVQKNPSTSYFILGACIGAIIMYLVRDVVEEAAPSFVDSASFSWYWALTAIVAAVCGLFATALKTVIYHVATIFVGSYGLATTVCGLVPVLGGPSLGSASFIAVMVACAAVGGFTQFLLAKRDPPAEATREGLIRK